MKTMEQARVEIGNQQSKYGKVNSLMQYINEGTLLVQHKIQPSGKAVGIDKVTKEMYQENLCENLKKLIEDMKKFSYRPLPVERKYIPKGEGKFRPLGIPSYEDKIVQGAFRDILDIIYEPKFYDFSYGFRKGKDCHQAILQVNHHIMFNKINYVVDADIKGFFDNLNHEWLIKFLENDIADKHFIRYIKRFLIGGVMEDGKKLETDRGTPQGGLISPVLANVYLHYALDNWFDYLKRSNKFKGEAYLVRYADDFVVLFQYENEANKFYNTLKKRLAKFNLELEENKSRIIPFGRYKGTKETFDFLGFTHINGKTRNNKYKLIHHTSKKKLKQKKQNVKAWLKENMHNSIKEIVPKLNIKLEGHYRYYGIFDNFKALVSFTKYVVEALYRTLRRRGQRRGWLTRAKLRETLKSLNFTRPKLYLLYGY
jgi:group II intron reverse transcriptase/maturase